jgi:hypothetical protein
VQNGQRRLRRRVDQSQTNLIDSAKLSAHGANSATPRRQKSWPDRTGLTGITRAIQVEPTSHSAKAKRDSNAGSTITRH